MMKDAFMAIEVFPKKLEREREREREREKLESVDVDSASPSAALENLALLRRDMPHAQRLLVVGIHPRVQDTKRLARRYSPQSPVVYVLRDRTEP